MIEVGCRYLLRIADREIQEFRVLEISPNGEWIKLLPATNAPFFWTQPFNIKVVQRLSAQPPDLTPGTTSESASSTTNED